MNLDVNYILKTLLNDEYEFVGDYKFNVDEFCPDFVNKDKTKIIELYGDYWHNKLDYIERDKRRIKSYTKNGYKTLIVWEHELKDLDLLSAKILQFHEIINV